MAIKKFNPTPMSRRFQEVIDYKKELTTDKPFKPLLEPKKRISGRNNSGRITVRHRAAEARSGTVSSISKGTSPVFRPASRRWNTIRTGRRSSPCLRTLMARSDTSFNPSV